MASIFCHLQQFCIPLLSSYYSLSCGGMGKAGRSILTSCSGALGVLLDIQIALNYHLITQYKYVSLSQPLYKAYEENRIVGAAEKKKNY